MQGRGRGGAGRGWGARRGANGGAGRGAHPRWRGRAPPAALGWAWGFPRMSGALPGMTAEDAGSAGRTGERGRKWRDGCVSPLSAYAQDAARVAAPAAGQCGRGSPPRNTRARRPGGSFFRRRQGDGGQMAEKVSPSCVTDAGEHPRLGTPRSPWLEVGGRSDECPDVEVEREELDSSLAGLRGRPGATALLCVQSRVSIHTGCDAPQVQSSS